MASQRAGRLKPGLHVALETIPHPDLSRGWLHQNHRQPDGITWDELQSIKNQIGYQDFLAFEMYPPEKDVVNVENMRHLWIPLGTKMPKCWKKL